MKHISVIIILLTAYSLTFGQNSQDTYTNNLDVAEYLYNKGIIDLFAEKSQIDTTGKLALSLAAYYEFSTRDIDYDRMRKILETYYGKDFSDKTPTQIETMFAKLMKQIDDIISTQNLSYLKEKF